MQIPIFDAMRKFPSPENPLSIFFSSSESAPLKYFSDCLFKNKRSRELRSSEKLENGPIQVILKSVCISCHVVYLWDSRFGPFWGLSLIVTYRDWGFKERLACFGYKSLSKRKYTPFSVKMAYNSYPIPCWSQRFYLEQILMFLLRQCHCPYLVHHYEFGCLLCTVFLA